jgi:lipopolysaccharide export system protein LptA
MIDCKQRLVAQSRPWLALLLVISVFAAVRPIAAAQKQVARYRDFTVKADEIRGKRGKAGAMSMEAIGSPEMISGDSYLTATKLAFEVGPNGITSATADGNVSIRSRTPARKLPDGSTQPGSVLTATGSRLAMDEQTGVVQLTGGVKIRSETEGEEPITASARTATIYRNRDELVLEGDVVASGLLPGSTTEGPATIRGGMLTVNLRTHEWSLKRSSQAPTQLDVRVRESGGNSGSGTSNR